jgi:hypothetical protein
MLTRKLHRAADGSCIQATYDKGHTVRPGEPGVAEEWLAFNPSTCQVRIEVGVPPPGFENGG